MLRTGLVPRLTRWEHNNTSRTCATSLLCPSVQILTCRASLTAGSRAAGGRRGPAAPLVPGRLASTAGRRQGPPLALGRAPLAGGRHCRAGRSSSSRSRRQWRAGRRCRMRAQRQQGLVRSCRARWRSAACSQVGCVGGYCGRGTDAAAMELKVQVIMRFGSMLCRTGIIGAPARRGLLEA